MLRPRRETGSLTRPLGLDAYRLPELIGSSVLVVEDEIPMQRQLELDLTELDYEVRIAGSAGEAQQLLSQERVAGIILDLVLDDTEEAGWTLLCWIRQNHPGLPVIVFSAALVNSASFRRAYELGASSYFVKGNGPMSHLYSELAARLVEGGRGRS